MVNKFSKKWGLSLKISWTGKSLYLERKRARQESTMSMRLLKKESMERLSRE